MDDPLTLARLGLALEDSFLYPGKKVLRLEADEEDISQLIETSEDNGISQTVSFIGPTHEGKSFLIRLLIEAAQNSIPASPVGEKTGYPKSSDPDTDDLSPTSADVRCYRSRWISNDHHNSMDQIMFLDLEGDCGGDLLPIELKSQIDEITEAMSEVAIEGESKKKRDKEDSLNLYYELRRNSVKEHLPRLAYVLSDVLVLVGSQDFSSHYYKDMVKAVAQTAAVNGIVDCEMPSLLLVQNKTNKRKSFDVDLITEQFLKSHDKQQSLFKHYLDVKCARVPDRDFFEDDESFMKACEPFIKTVRAMIDRHVQERKLRGNDYSERLWVHLARETLRRFHYHQGLRMGLILTDICVAKHHRILGRVIQFFGSINTDPTKSSYLLARTSSLRAIACYYCKELISTKTPLSDSALESRKQVLMAQLQVDVKKFLEIIHQLEPCESVNDERNCTSVRSNHPSNHHHNPKSVSFKGGRMMRTIKKKLKGEGTKISKTEWKGKFQFTDPSSEQELLDIVSNMLNSIQTGLSEEKVVLCLVENLRMSLPPDNSSIIWPYKCFICMDEEPEHQWPCMHFFCNSCTNIINEISRKQGEKRLNGIIDPTSIINIDLCPICKGAVFTPTVGAGSESKSDSTDLDIQIETRMHRRRNSITTGVPTPSPTAKEQEEIMKTPNRIIQHTRFEHKYIVEAEWANGVCNWVPLSTLVHTKAMQQYIKKHPKLERSLERQRAKEQKQKK